MYAVMYFLLICLILIMRAYAYVCVCVCVCVYVFNGVLCARIYAEVCCVCVCVQVCAGSIALVLVACFQPSEKKIDQDMMSIRLQPSITVRGKCWRPPHHDPSGWDK